MVNKYLYPKGGSETYMLKLGEQLKLMGHEVQYFGMDSPKRCVSNSAGAYVSEIDFHAGGAPAQKLLRAPGVVFSPEAYRKMSLVLKAFKPDAVHLNNFNYQLTPAVLLAADRWRRQTGCACRIVYTAHDCQLVCPSHLGARFGSKALCDECAGGRFYACARHKCIHGSFARSLLGSAEAYFWRWLRVYSRLDAVICCSDFMLRKLSVRAELCGKLSVMHNFVAINGGAAVPKRDYVLYFGRYSAEKGIRTLLAACCALPEISFVFAGGGSLAAEIDARPNAANVGFKQGGELAVLIAAARFSVCPSEWSENCPLSVMESIACGTPVLGARIGGIPELIEDGKNGLLFESGDLRDLTAKLLLLWTNAELLAACTRGCAHHKFDTARQYAEKMLSGYYCG